jgi:hypothetical protein
VDEGYFDARELKSLTNDTNALIEQLRLPGDIVFIVGGAVPALYIAYLILFTEVDEPEGVASATDVEAAAARLT